MDVILLRHGETQWNKDRRYIGWQDEPLCEEGASALRALPWNTDAVYVSPLARAKQSARIFFPDAELIEVEGFKEIDFGRFEGKTAGELAGDSLYTAWVDSGCMTAIPEGEPVELFKRRTAESFRSLMDERITSRHADAPLVIVAHGGTIMAIAEAYGHPRKDYFSWSCPPGRGYQFTTNPAEWLDQQKIHYSSMLDGRTGNTNQSNQPAPFHSKVRDNGRSEADIQGGRL